MATGGAEKCWECPLKDGVIGNIGRNFPSLKSGRIQKCQFVRPREAKENSKLLQLADIFRRWIYPTFDFAPVAGVEADSGAKIAQGKPFL